MTQPSSTPPLTREAAPSERGQWAVALNKVRAWLIESGAPDYFFTTLDELEYALSSQPAPEQYRESELAWMMGEIVDAHEIAAEVVTRYLADREERE